MDERPPEPDTRRGRIFGIGLNKTGTMTFDKALSILGFESLHDGGPPVHEAVKRAIDEGAPLLSHIDQRYDAFSDIGLLSRRFGILDRQYPGSRFVLTVRPVEEWLDSRRRHVERNLALREIGQYDGSFLVVDYDKWRGEWDHHVARVHTYFEGRSDFLEVDLTHDPSWEPLCQLLNVDVPDQPFPWINKGDEITIPSKGAS